MVLMTQYVEYSLKIYHMSYEGSGNVFGFSLAMTFVSKKRGHFVSVRACSVSRAKLDEQTGRT